MTPSISQILKLIFHDLNPRDPPQPPSPINRECMISLDLWGERHIGMLERFRRVLHTVLCFAWLPWQRC